VPENRWPGETLRAIAVSRSFAGVDALRDVTLELHRHEVVGLIGPNGAGKTTLVNVMSGFDFPTTGSVEFAGRDVTRWSPSRRRRAGLARTFQRSRSFRGLTVRENRRADGLLDLLELRHRADAEAASLPHGDERKLGVARALACNPRYVLMDEPAAGLPDSEVPDFAAAVRSVRDDFDAGVLVIEHNMSLVMAVCDRIHVLDEGRTLAAGTPAEIRGNLDVAAAYLGDTAVDTLANA